MLSRNCFSPFYFYLFKNYVSVEINIFQHQVQAFFYQFYIMVQLLVIQEQSVEYYYEKFK